MPKKKHSGNNDLALSYRVDRLPRRMRRDVVLRRMAAFITRGEGLPESWQITLRWKNSPRQAWREDEFQTAISESRQGFVSLVLGRIRRDMGNVREIERNIERLIEGGEEKRGRKKRRKAKRRGKVRRGRNVRNGQTTKRKKRRVRKG